MRRISFETWLVVLVMVFHLYAFFLPANSLVMGWYNSDDAFYYFKTAQNISEGHGITFDRLGRDSGFHPLWMLVIIPVFALARFDLLLPLRLVVILSALLSAGTAIVLYRLVKRYLTPLAAAFTALFWAFYPFIHKRVTELGMESAISAFFLALLIYRLAKSEDSKVDVELDGWNGRTLIRNLRPVLLTGLVATLAVFSRLDNIFIVLAAGVWLAFRPVRPRYLLLSDIVLIVTGVLWSYMVRIGFGPHYEQFAGSSYWMVVLALALRIPLYYFAGLYNRPAEGKNGLAFYLVKAAGASLLASVLLSGLMIALQALNVFRGFPRLVLAYEAVFGLAAVLAVRLAARLISPRAAQGDEPIHWKPTLLRLAGYFAPIGLSLAAYMVWSLNYFGTPMPVSGQIKRWWGTLPNPIYGQPVDTTLGLLGFSHGNNGPWAFAQSLAAWPEALPLWFRLLVFWGIALVILAWQWKRTKTALHVLAWFPLAAGSYIQMISYTGTGYLHMRNWYWVGHMLAITLLLGIVIDHILCRVEQTATARKSSQEGGRTARMASGLVILICALVIIHGVKEMVRRMPMYVRPARAEAYLRGVHQLEANTVPGSRVGSTGGGVIAYFVTDRIIVNLDGLMNTSEYFNLLRQGQASQYLDRIGLEYVYCGETVITDSDPYFQFKDKLEKINSFGETALFRWKR
ncbi:MAG: hypothetical protein EHM21_03350 [Chloroflexi bacterium]|nr:MAG: hypothetical protein EHM21_03350 [Chloroflexota bacterium]